MSRWEYNTGIYIRLVTV